MNKALKNWGTFLVMEQLKDFNFPEELLEFMSKDDQGIEGIEFMLKDKKLCSRIPPTVRAQYEVLNATLQEQIEKACNEAISNIQEVLSNPQSLQQVAHTIIQDMYELSGEQK